MKIWYDITNTPQVHFLLAVERLIKKMDLSCLSVYTAREFSETSKLLAQKVGEGNFVTIGGHYGKSYWRKVYGLLSRFSSIRSLHLDYDVSISCGSENAIWYSFLHNKKSIAFGDNDLARQWTYAPFVSYAFFPSAIDKKVLEKQGLRRKLYQYNGYKEDIYLSDYRPDSTFLNSLPFDHYVVVRPENVMANYIRNSSVNSITPELLKSLSDRNINVLYLPRYAQDREYSRGLNNIYIPDNPINGIDACFFADAVLTGAGTFAREAACLGIPSLSFFAGKDLLAVDKQMISEGKMFFSRDVDLLVKYLLSSNKVEPDLSRSKRVASEVTDVLSEIISM